MTLFPFLQLVSFLIMLFVWSYVLGQRGQDRLRGSFLVFTGFNTLWILIELVLYNFPAMDPLTPFLFGVMLAIWASVGLFFMLFAYRLVERPLDWFFWSMAVLTSVAILAGLIFDDYVVLGYERRSWGIREVWIPWAHALVSLPDVLAASFGLFLVWKRWRPERDQRTRSTYLVLLVGGIFSMLIIGSVNILLPDILLIEIPLLGSSALVLFVTVVFLAMRRYQFLTPGVEHLAEDLFDDVKDGIVLVDEGGVVRQVNRAARVILGSDGTEIEEQQAKTVLPGFDLDRDFRRKEITVRGSGIERVLAMSQSTSYLEGYDRGRIVILRDISEEKSTEQLLIESHEQLEKEVRRRTAELHQAQKMEAVGTLAGGIAHDFNNLLAAILGFATAARDDLPADSPVRGDFQEVLLAARRGRDIVQQLLNFSRKENPIRKVVDAGRLMADAIALLEVSIPATIDIHRDFTDETCLVMADPSQIHQAFVNLGTNSYQSMKEGAGKIQFNLHPVELGDDEAKALRLSPGTYVKISIRDTGEGIPEEHMEKVFEPFFTTKKPGEGTGLGLAMVHRIILDHEGAIGLESERGKGTTFSIFLPRAEGTSEGPDSSDSMVMGGDEHILIVDDKEQVVRVGRRLLESLGYKITGFGDPEEALREYRRAPNLYDLVVTDQTMPQMNGIELAVELLKITPRLPIILVSGNATPEEQRLALRVGVGVCMSKPLSRSQLALAIREQLERAREVLG